MARTAALRDNALLLFMLISFRPFHGTLGAGVAQEYSLTEQYGRRQSSFAERPYGVIPPHRDSRWRAFDDTERPLVETVLRRRYRFIPPVPSAAKVLAVQSATPDKW